MNVLDQIKLAPGELSSDLFSRVAEATAKHVNQTDKDRRKPPNQSQHRKFYDEICMWDNKCQIPLGNFEQHLPFILMLKAKIAYAKGRKPPLVNDQYESIINHCLGELEKNQVPETLHNLKLFMEAFTGFYKVHGPRN